MMNPRRLVCMAFLALFLTAGCGLPKIVLIDDPLTPMEHLDLGRAYEQQGKTELAEKEYKLAAKQNPLGHLYLGNLYFSQDDANQAEKAYKKAIDGMPDNFEAYNNLAWLYYTRQTRLDRAEELARRALELAPADKKDQPRDTLEKIKTLRQSP
jgi:tetratricopeptide (TPR) repeat protein